MADEADRASDEEERHRASAISDSRKITRRLFPRGECHSCGAPVSAAQIFCDRDCADEHAYMVERGLI